MTDVEQALLNVAKAGGIRVSSDYAGDNVYNSDYRHHTLYQMDIERRTKGPPAAVIYATLPNGLSRGRAPTTTIECDMVRTILAALLADFEETETERKAKEAAKAEEAAAEHKAKLAALVEAAAKLIRHARGENEEELSDLAARAEAAIQGVGYRLRTAEEMAADDEAEEENENGEEETEDA